MITVLQGDALVKLQELPDESVQCCVTSPPYWGLRDYGQDGQLGLEKTPEEYVAKMVAVFREVRRVLRKDGTFWLNLGDSYAGSGKGLYADGNCYLSEKSSKQKTNVGSVGVRMATVEGDNGHTHGVLPPPGLKSKDLVGIPWRVAFALQADGWWLRQDIIWNKPNPMPESVTDRCTKAHEYLFLLTKSSRYYYDNEAIKEQANPDDVIRDRDSTKLNNTPGRSRMGGLVVNGYENRNKRSVWTVSTRPYPEAHFATYPPDLIQPCIMAGTKPGDIVLDPFAGSGTTGMVAIELGRKTILIELNPKYVALIEQRCTTTIGLPL